MPEQTPIQFPVYEPPRNGIPLMSDPSQAKPLVKMIRRMMKPAKPPGKKGRIGRPPATKGRRKGATFY